MSILIKGMKMPTSCVDCSLGGSLCCHLLPGIPALWAEYTNAVREKRRHSDCPLVEIQLNTRLVNADALGLTDIEIIMCDGDYKEALKMLIDKIEHAPTIEPEITRCKDCRKRSTDGYCTVNVRNVHGLATVWWRPEDNDFCSHAERREECEN